MARKQKAKRLKRKTGAKAAQKPRAKAVHNVRFPGESASYRRARDRLLRAEIDLRRQVESVAAQRRKLPLGGLVPLDYVFEAGSADLDDTSSVHALRLSDLFDKDASLVLYSFMYGPAMEHPCPSCTSILDALNGTAPHATQRINFAVVARSPIGRIRDFARSRGWRNLRLLSSAKSTYNHDYHGETEDGSQIPNLNVFVRRGDRIHHSFASELLFAPADRRQNHRHVDMVWPLWNLFDFTPEGRGSTWYPKLAYAP